MKESSNYSLEKFDARIVHFFQHITNRAQKINISLGFLINIFLMLSLLSSVINLIYVYNEEGFNINAVIKIMPLCIVVLYIRHLLKKAQVTPVHLFVFRQFTLILNCVNIFNFVFKIMIQRILKHMDIWQTLSACKSECSYMCIYLFFFMFIYFLSCVQKHPNEKNIRWIKKINQYKKQHK